MNNVQGKSDSIYMTVRMKDVIINGPLHHKVGAIFGLFIAVIVDAFVFVFGNVCAGFLNTFVARGAARNLANHLLEDESVQRNLARNAALLTGNRNVAGGFARLVQQTAKNKDVQNDVADAGAQVVDNIVWKIAKNRLLHLAILLTIPAAICCLSPISGASQDV